MKGCFYVWCVDRVSVCPSVIKSKLSQINIQQIQSNTLYVQENSQFIYKVIKKLQKTIVDHRQLVGLHIYCILRSQIFQSLRVGNKLSEKTPSLFSCNIQGWWRLSAKNIDILEEIVRQLPTLKLKSFICFYYIFIEYRIIGIPLNIIFWSSVKSYVIVYQN